MLASIGTLLQELTGDQISALSLLTLIIIQVFKFVWVGLLKWRKPTKAQMRLFVFVLAVPIGLIFSGLRLPPISDPLEFAQALISTAGQVLVYSGLVYQFMLNDLLGWLDKPIVKRLGRSLLAA